eukprot:UN23382
MDGIQKDESYDMFVRRVHAKGLETADNRGALGFIGFPSAKNPRFNDAFPGKSIAVVITEIDYKHFAKWEKEKWEHRGVTYDTLKNI